MALSTMTLRQSESQQRTEAQPAVDVDPKLRRDEGLGLRVVQAPLLGSSISVKGLTAENITHTVWFATAESVNDIAT